MNLLIAHPYYCSENNFDSGEAAQRYENFQEFYDIFHDADIDMNLIFRFDVQRDEDNNLYAQIFMIKQRKGIFVPITIEHIEEKDFEALAELLKKHWDKLKEIWKPISEAL